jgi:hypothetical protein
MLKGLNLAPFVSDPIEIVLDLTGGFIYDPLISLLFGLLILVKNSKAM